MYCSSSCAGVGAYARSATAIAHGGFGASPSERRTVPFTPSAPTTARARLHRRGRRDRYGRRGRARCGVAAPRRPSRSRRRVCVDNVEGHDLGGPAHRPGHEAPRGPTRWGVGAPARSLRSGPERQARGPRPRRGARSHRRRTCRAGRTSSTVRRPVGGAAHRPRRQHPLVRRRRRRRPAPRPSAAFVVAEVYLEQRAPAPPGPRTGGACHGWRWRE